MTKKGKKSQKKTSANKSPLLKNDNQVLAKKEEGLTLHEQKAIDSAVDFINKQIDTASSSLIEVGEYLLKNFFEGDLQKVQNRAPRKGISLRKLAEHPDINMSFQGLSNAVNLAVQEKELGSVQAIGQLTPTHKIHLLKVPDLKEKKKYVSRIGKDKLTVRQFEAILVSDGYSKPRGMAAIESEKERKLLRSGFQKYLSPFEAIMEMNLSSLFGMPKTNVKSTYEAAKKARKQLDKIIVDLEGKLKLFTHISR